MSEPHRYSSEYFSYHRNMTVLFILCICVTVFNISIDLTKLGPIKIANGNSGSLVVNLLPVVFFAAAIYHWLLFHAEWKECAEPHKTQTSDAVSKLDAEMQNLIQKHREIKDQIDTANKIFDQRTEQFILSNVLSEIESIKSRAFIEISTELSNIRSGIRLDMDNYRQSFSQKSEKRNNKISRAISNYYPDDENILNIIADINSFYSDDLQQKLDDDIPNFINDIENLLSQKIQETSDQMSYNYKSMDTHSDAIREVAKLSRSLRDSLTNFTSRSDEFQNLVVTMKKFSKSKGLFVWIKTEFAGINLPIFLAVISFAGIIYYYVDLYKKWIGIGAPCGCMVQ